MKPIFYKGKRGVSLDFKAGYLINVKRVRRLLALMGHKTIYPKRNLSKLGSAKYKRPYLLKGLAIKEANEMWCTDIAYLPMARNTMYLMALIDVYSRKIVGWELWNTLFTTDCICDEDVVIKK